MLWHAPSAWHAGSAFGARGGSSDSSLGDGGETLGTDAEPGLG